MRQIAKLAETIWHEHYEPILGVDQVNYMVEHFQSLRAMKDQIANQGYRYRGLGLASRVLAIIKEEAKAGTGRIQLTVNRFNADSIAVYQKWGVVTLREEKTPIGGGYFMDDYIMELDCRN